MDKAVIGLNRKATAKRILKVSLAAALAVTAGVCVFRRLPECFASEQGALAAAAFTLTDGDYRLDAEESAAPTRAAASKPSQEQKSTEPARRNPVKLRDKTDYYDSFAPHEGEAKYSVAERTILPDGDAVGSGYIKNGTGIDYDFSSIKNEPLSFSVRKNTKAPQVLIYHTHTSEGYLDEDVDYFYESFYSRTQNTDFNVVAVGERIAKTLEKHGIAVLHDKTVHDSSYNGSYDRSAQTVCADMEDHPEIKVALDIHRDALGTEEQKIKTVFEYNGRKAAQIMIMAGCDCYGERGFDRWQHNLSFALKLEDAAERMFPGMTRPVTFGFFAYNEFLSDGLLLIEVGTDANSIDEAEYSGELLAEALAEVLS